MNVLILGAGQVGRGIAHYLTSRKIDVTVIEKSQELVFEIRNSANINIIQGNALDAEVLKNANAENASHLIATMSNDEQNIVACKLAESLFKIKTKIARTRSSSFLGNSIFELFLKDNFGIDVLIHPELEIAKHISDVVLIRGAFDVIRLGRVIIIGLKCLDNTEVLNTTFKHFQGITNLNLFVLTIVRDGVTFFPTSKDVLLPNDEVYIAAGAEHINEVMELFGYPQRKQKILIIGGGNIGTFIMKIISAQTPDSNITMLEKSKDRAEKISQDYPNITTILGDALNHDTLQEISSDVDTAIVATDHDETNVLSSLFLKKFKVNRILALAKNKNYDSLLTINSGCSIVDPSAITIATIIKQSGNGKILSASYLKNQQVYIVEAEVTESCIYLNQIARPLYEKDRIIPIFIERNDKIIPAGKNVAIELNDRIIMLVSKDCMNSMEKMFSSYFFSREDDL
ncbi:MAG: Trk system potassium transporter TrkA [Holosporaceae bacterium]|jgi:trk system potassium uptake protein TrkA|nr:Trk system potassium transporter TrkA [Holosporaceae bacterium]